MTTPAVEYVATAGQRDFDVTFPFLSPLHIEVLSNGIAVAILEWVGPSRLRLAAPLAGGELVTIQRNTPIEQQLVKFQNGAILTQEDLNLAVQQLLFKQQEVVGLYNNSLRRARVRLAENNGIVADPGAVTQVLAEMVLENEVLANFRQHIANINLNATAIIDQAFQTDRIDASLTTTRQSLTTLTSTVDTLLGGDPGTGIATLIQDETNARIAGDQALVATVSLIGAKSGDGLAFIADLNKLQVSPTESFAQRFSALSASIGAAQSAVVDETSARISAVAAEAARITSLTTRMGDAESAIVAETSARSTAVSAQATRIDGLLTRVGSAETSITSEVNARSTADTALGSRIDTLGVRVDNNAAAIISEQQTRANADTAEANARQALAARVATAESAITTEQTARANGDTSLTQTLALLGAKNANGTAFVLDLNKAMVSGTVSLGTRLSGIDTAVGSNASAIVNEQTARTSADSALASDISVLSTTVGSHTASISTLSETLNGVRARYGVALNVDGHITGFVQNNDGVSGSFTIVADRFAIVTPGTVPITPFAVTAEGVRINGNLVLTGSLTYGQLAQGAATETAAAYVAASFGMTPAYQDAASASLPTVGGKVRLDFSAKIDVVAQDGSTGVTYRVLRGATVIREGTLTTAPGRQDIVTGDAVSANPQTQPVYTPVSGHFPVFLIDDAAPAGLHTYTVQLACSTGSASERSIMLLETRR